MLKDTIKEIKLEGEDSNKLERAFYELKAFQDNLSYLLDAHSEDGEYINSVQFKSYNDKSAELYKAYSDFKDYITIKYVPQEFLEEDKYSWVADFEHGQILIKEN